MIGREFPHLSTSVAIPPNPRSNPRAPKSQDCTCSVVVVQNLQTQRNSLLSFPPHPKIRNGCGRFVGFTHSFFCLQAGVPFFHDNDEPSSPTLFFFLFQLWNCTFICPKACHLLLHSQNPPPHDPVYTSRLLTIGSPFYRFAPAAPITKKVIEDLVTAFNDCTMTAAFFRVA